MWLFGKPDTVELHLREENRMGGFMELPGADVEWYLSLERQDVPLEFGEQRTYRSITIDEEEGESSQGFDDRHTRDYERTLAGQGGGSADAGACVERAPQSPPTAPKTG